MIKRVRTGTPGLDTLIEGGLVENSVTAICGTSGAGKTIMGHQFLRHSLEQGGNALLLSLEDSEKVIIEGIKRDGWEDVEKYVEDRTFTIITIPGPQLKEFIDVSLSHMVSTMEKASNVTSILIDPLNPLLWSVKEEYKQREMLQKMLSELRKIGTIMITVEKHKAGETAETVVPVYLSDTAFEISFIGIGGIYNKVLKITKMRWTNHGQGVYPYHILKDIGLVVEPAELVEEEIGAEKVSVDTDKIKKVKTLASKLPDAQKSHFLKQIEGFEQWSQDIPPDRILELLLKHYDLKL